VKECEGKGGETKKKAVTHVGNRVVMVGGGDMGKRGGRKKGSTKKKKRLPIGRNGSKGGCTCPGKTQKLEVSGRTS